MDLSREIVECLHTDEVPVHRVSGFLRFRTHGLDEESLLGVVHLVERLPQRQYL